MLTNLARLISFVFHPLFILFYLLMILLLVNPYLFSIQDHKDQVFLVVNIFMISVMFPIISIVLLKFVGFVDSFQMNDPKERIGPLIACCIFYLWLYVNLRNLDIVPQGYQIFVLGSVIGLFIGFFLNNFTKISLHGIGMGGFIASIFIIRYKLAYHSFTLSVFDKNIQIGIDWLIIACVLIAGAVLSSRLYLKAHTKQDVYGGFLVGLIAQFLALRYIGI